MNGIIKFHSHGGYYGDGNSHYWSNDMVVNFKEGVTTILREDSYGGQLAEAKGVAPNQYLGEPKTRGIINLTPAKQQEAYKLLAQIGQNFAKYGRNTLKILSYRQLKWIEGRLHKAIDIMNVADYYGEDNSRHVFVFPALNKVVTFYYEWSYNHKYQEYKEETLFN